MTWDGSSPAVDRIRDVLVAHTPAGGLRLVLQQLTLRAHGREAGRHESIDSIVDVEGNLVVVPIAASVREDPTISARLDSALDDLRAAIAADLGTEVDSLEVIADADGARRVMVVLSVEVAPEEIAAGSTHPAIHDGVHHISHHAPALDDLRDRLAGPERGGLRRLWDAVVTRLRPGR